MDIDIQLCISLKWWFDTFTLQKDYSVAMANISISQYLSFLFCPENS